MREQHTRARSPLEAALWEFRYQEKQWQAEKAALRRDADAQHKQAIRLQQQLNRLQTEHQYTLRELASAKAAIQRRNDDLRDLQSRVQDQDSAACEKEELQNVLNAALSRLEAAIGAAQSQEARVAYLAKQVEGLQQQRDWLSETSGDAVTPRQNGSRDTTASCAPGSLCTTSSRSDG